MNFPIKLIGTDHEGYSSTFTTPLFDIPNEEVSTIINSIDPIESYIKWIRGNELYISPSKCNDTQRAPFVCDNCLLIFRMRKWCKRFKSVKMDFSNHGP